MADVYLTQRDIDYISRVVATEVPASLKRTDPAEYERMVNAVTDTMINRVASDSYPDTITGVANQSRQFSKITGPARLDPYGSVQAAPKASQDLQSMVAGRVADLAQGAESEINGALSYANPKFSDADNLAEWVNPMIEAGAIKLGLGDMVHYHGLAPGQEPVENVTVTAEGIPSGGIPVPYGPNDDPFANSLQAQATDGFSGVANPVSMRDTAQRQDLPATDTPTNEWGVINGVGPAYYPTVNSWADIANAPAVRSPMDSVTATADLNAIPSLAAAARANPTMSSSISESQPLAISQADIDRAFFNPTGQGQFDPSFTERLMSPQTPVVPTAVETTSYTPDSVTPQAVDIASSRFSTPAKTSRIGSQELTDLSRMSPLAGLVGPRTNTQSFMDAPQPADLGSFPTAISAQRGILDTPPTVDPSTTASIPAMQTPNFAQAMVPSMPSLNTFGARPSLPSTTTGIATPQQQAAGYQQFAALAPNITNLSGFTGIFDDGTAYQNSVAPAAQAPEIDTVEVAEQPTVTEQTATVEGPATTPAIDQRPTQSITTNEAPSQAKTKGLFNGMVNKGTIAGGVLGSILAGGPLGGAIGALVGHQLAKGGITNPLGGLSRSFSGPSAFSPPTNQIAGGAVNIGGLYGGAFSPGTYAVANNGATITAQPNGYTSYVNRYGVNEVVSPTGQISHNFGSLFGGAPDPTAPDPNATT